MILYLQMYQEKGLWVPYLFPIFELSLSTGDAKFQDHSIKYFLNGYNAEGTTEFCLNNIK
jgi:hypothetical protein